MLYEHFKFSLLRNANVGYFEFYFDGGFAEDACQFDQLVLGSGEKGVFYYFVGV